MSGENSVNRKMKTFNRMLRFGIFGFNPFVITIYLIIIAYVQMGKLGSCIELSEKVPTFWKCCSGAALLVLFFFSALKIEARAMDPGLPRLRWWIFWTGIVAFVFAIVTADRRSLFFGFSLGWVVMLYCIRFYFRHQALKCQRTVKTSHLGSNQNQPI